MYRRLTFIFELASNFIAAHEDVDILELLHEGPVAYQLALEKNRQLQAARTTLSQQLPVFPELARSLKTRVRVVTAVGCRVLLWLLLLVLYVGGGFSGVYGLRP